MRHANIVIIAVIALSFIAGLLVYPHMPDQMASHWNTRGDVDSYMSKFWGVFMMPLVTLGLFLLFLLIPKIDPLKRNIEQFRKHFDWFIVLMVIFLLYIYTLTIFWNFGYRFDMGSMFVPGIAILFFFIGVMVEKAKRNWFIGIRTPWTLSSDRVWDATHKVGGKLFKACGVIALLGILFPAYTFWFVILPVLIVAVYTLVHSYVMYQKLECKDKVKTRPAPARSPTRKASSKKTRAGKAKKKTGKKQVRKRPKKSVKKK